MTRRAELLQYKNHSIQYRIANEQTYIGNITLFSIYMYSWPFINTNDIFVAEGLNALLPNVVKIHCRIWSWSPMSCEKLRNSVNKTQAQMPRFLSLLRQSIVIDVSLALSHQYYVHHFCALFLWRGNLHANRTCVNIKCKKWQCKPSDGASAVFWNK